MIIWLSLRGLTGSEIVALFEYDPRTVRRWIDCYNHGGVAGLEDHPRSGAPRVGSAGLGRRIRLLLREPGAWTVTELRRRLGYPAMSLATLARRVCEQAGWRWRRPGLQSFNVEVGMRIEPDRAVLRMIERSQDSEGGD